ncbi:hypothetical protein BKA82DRAFT_212799 [Pisolithus tinctorius]|uniref:Uncharacterized protein n=1 Tax=Pisolithus tinctorius Marx 270 TaxID=870435 RepID=A0A0C3PN60_PISTI|nr:hypothetical protein BKA82DRAFT_212799 [Pisolithus tinctorius]KIO09814.1 hypothetical protein M404DRAFT_212799 [Pisolithus tinctorius Marx 270]
MISMGSAVIILDPRLVTLHATIVWVFLFPPLSRTARSHRVEAFPPLHGSLYTIPNQAPGPRGDRTGTSRMLIRSFTPYPLTCHAVQSTQIGRPRTSRSGCGFQWEYSSFPYKVRDNVATKYLRTGRWEKYSKSNNNNSHF